MKLVRGTPVNTVSINEVTMSERIKQLIVDELQSVPKKRMMKNKAMVLCPFHPDKNPSATINLDETQTKAPLGWFRCFGCRASVPWNNYAATVGLKAVGKAKKDTADDYVNPERFQDELLGEEESEDIDFEKRDPLEFFDFQTDEWRGIPTKILKRVGARLAYSDRTGNFYAWLPVYIKGELKGYVKAELEKPEDPSRPSYINAPGGWSNAYGLLFYDYAVKLMNRLGVRTIVLCEGPRDALRLLRYKIPAVAVLGAINWSEEKRFLLEQAGAQRVIIFMDGDDAGIEATKVIYKHLRGYFELKYMKLWKYRVPRMKKGKQEYKVVNKKKVLLWDNELDPFTCPKSLLLKVKGALA